MQAPPSTHEDHVSAPGRGPPRLTPDRVSNMNRLESKIAIITGAARGMGAATARRFVAEGAQVVIADLLDDTGTALAQELGASARFVHHDVTSESSWDELAKTTIEAFGGIDILVNNAGVLLFRTLADTTKSDFERVLSINLVGAFLGTRIIGAHMVERGHGSIINISSSDGTKVAALEYGHRGVRVNSVQPGGVNTPMINPQHASAAEMDQRFRDIPLQRSGRPEEIAATTLFLASDEASYLCGAEIAVDGGATAGQYYQGLPGAPGV